MSLGQNLCRGRGERKGRTVRGGRRGKERERLGAGGDGGKGEGRKYYMPSLTCEILLCPC